MGKTSVAFFSGFNCSLKQHHIDLALINTDIFTCRRHLAVTHISTKNGFEK